MPYSFPSFWNNPGRLRLTDLAERFERQAKGLELQKVSTHPAKQAGGVTCGREDNQARPALSLVEDLNA
jgi:hypothetical protein